MNGQSGLAKDQPGTKPLRITGIYSAHRRRQEKLRRPGADNAPSPINYRFKRLRTQIGCTRCKSEAHLQNLSAAEWKPLWGPAKYEACAGFASRCLERYPNVRTHRFQSHGIA